MKRILIIGNSIAAAKLIEEVRAKGQDAELTLLLPDGYFPYHRYLLGDFVSRRVARKQLYYFPEEKYTEMAVQTVVSAKIARIHTNKRRVTTEDKQSFDYDILVLTDAPWKKPEEIKGISKTGVYCLRKIGDIDQMASRFHLVETVFIQADGPSGLKAACGLKNSGKEVIWVTTQPHILSPWLEAAAADLLQKSLEEAGVRILPENSIQEILGEGEVKAVRLKSGKVIGADTVLWGDRIQPDLRWLKETGLAGQERIPVDSFFQSKEPGIFALDEMAHFRPAQELEEYDSYPMLLEQQGRIVAAYLSGQELEMEWPLAEAAFSLPGLSVRLIGRTSGRGEEPAVTETDEAAKMYKKIFLQDGGAAGVLLINGDNDLENVRQLVKDKNSLARTEPGPDPEAQKADQCLNP